MMKKFIYCCTLLAGLSFAADDDVFNILSLDGGGIRGLITA
jgi:hypothetical protein